MNTHIHSHTDLIQVDPMGIMWFLMIAMLGWNLFMQHQHYELKKGLVANVMKKTICYNHTL